MNRKLVYTILAGLAVCSLIVPAQQALAIGGSSASLPSPSFSRAHPDTTFDPPHFNLYTGDDLGSEWTLFATQSADFDEHPVVGTLTSQVFQHSSGRLLFRYQLSNTGEEELGQPADIFRTANIDSWSPAVPIIDSGIWVPGRDPEEFVQGDPATIGRAEGSGDNGQVNFAFEAGTGTPQGSTLEPGETSAWVYYETMAATYTEAFATIQDSGDSADDVLAFAPGLEPLIIPEPLTMLAVGLGLGGLARYAKKRRRG
ncbi:MAG: hypothetical protein ACLFVU_10355 [Phycisphaerae bacterium]